MSATVAETTTTTTTTRRKKASDAVKRSPEDDHRRMYLFGLYRRSRLTFLQGSVATV